MSRFILTVFPGAPFEARRRRAMILSHAVLRCGLEAVYTLAEGSKRCFVPKGSNVVVEGETGEDRCFKRQEKSTLRLSKPGFQPPFRKRLVLSTCQSSACFKF